MPKIRLLGDGVTQIEAPGGACAFLGMGRTAIFGECTSGALFSLKRGGRRVVPRREQLRYLRFGPRTKPLVVE